MLQVNHHDRWLAEFLSSHGSPEATKSLHQAIVANRKGDLDGAIRAADVAIKLFRQIGNEPGILRAQFERIYSLRRQSEGQACADESVALDQALRQTSFSWLQAQALLERSSCLAMIGRFDDAWTTALRARVSAERANYRSLQLRAIAMEAALHTNEGRLAQAWRSTAIGLRLFFNEPFPPERGFQFYSELEFFAEEAGQWELAALLQKEAIFYIRSQGRFDFEATADFHLAAVEEVLGDFQTAKDEIAAGKDAFRKLPHGPSREFLEAESRIALAALEAKFGSPASAEAYLSGLDLIVSRADNFTVRLNYEQAHADIERRLGNRDAEVLHLRRCIAIGNKGFDKLTSPRDRWDWERLVGQAYRRLLELQISAPHDPLQALADWENYRTAASSAKPGLMIEAEESGRQRLLERVKSLRNSTAIVFAALPDHLVAWTADDRGVREVQLPLNKSELVPLVKLFSRICSDPSSSIEKVKSTGLRLYELLLRPLNQELGLRTSLFIESDGILGTVPWPALTTPDGMYLGARFEIVNMPEFIAEVSRAGEKAGKNHFLIAYPGPVTLGGELYPPLAHAQEEAESLAKDSENSVYLENEGATPQSLADNLPHASYFHFAGHAVTREFGGELLAHGADGGELLSASTISSLNLKGLRLAVLAACNTGTSWEASRNPNGLVGAFLSAGTHRVVASSWAVDSKSTSDLMSRFYAGLNSQRDQGSVEASWREAISRTTALHPYYWAGFQVFGSPN